jgi:hypothetical protein
MGRLECVVAFVQGVAVSIVCQCACVPQAVGAGQPFGVARGGVFIDVVAQEQNQVRVVSNQMVPGGVIPVLPTLARCKRQPEFLRKYSGRRRSAGATDGARRITQHEAVVVPTVGLQARYLDMHAVAEAGVGRGFALLHDL